MPQILIVLLSLGIIASVYFGMNTNQNTSSNGTKESPVESSLMTVTKTKVMSGNYSEKKLTLELEKEYSSEKVSEIINKLEVDFTQELLDAYNQYLLEGMEDEEIRKNLLEVDLFEESAVEQALSKTTK